MTESKEPKQREVIKIPLPFEEAVRAALETKPAKPKRPTHPRKKNDGG